MSKYIYCSGKIYANPYIDSYKNMYVGFSDNAVVNLNTVDYVEFDSFEDLIEVGDIIEFAVDFDYYVKSEVLDFQIIGEDDRKVINVFLDKVNYQSVKSIWKPVNNTFIKVCYKENGSWVID